jgi:hypothetical protein
MTRRRRLEILISDSELVAIRDRTLAAYACDRAAAARAGPGPAGDSDSNDHHRDCAGEHLWKRRG